MSQLFLKADMNLTELVELIVSQNNIGSTIKVRVTIYKCCSILESRPLGKSHGLSASVGAFLFSWLSDAVCMYDVV